MRKLLLLLLVTTTGCLWVACNSTKSEPTASDLSGFTIREVMQSMVAPQADSLWNAVSTSVSEKGIETKAPSNDEEWATMRHAAVTLAEARNVITLPGRKVAKAGEHAKDPKIELEPEQIDALIAQDKASFVKYAHELQDSVAQAIKAIDSKSADGLSNAGTAIDAACENCHKKYWYPNDERAQQQ